LYGTAQSTLGTVLLCAQWNHGKNVLFAPRIKSHCFAITVLTTVKKLPEVEKQHTDLLCGLMQSDKHISNQNTCENFYLKTTKTYSGPLRIFNIES